MPTIEGGCLCGAVRYRSDAEPLMQVICHCETCRKNSGSAFSMNVAVPQDALRIESGSPRRYEDHSGASAKSSTGSSVATVAPTSTATARHTAPSCSLRLARSTTRTGSRPTCISGAPKNCPGSLFPRAPLRHPPTRAERDSNSPASSQRNRSTRLHRDEEAMALLHTLIGTTSRRERTCDDLALSEVDALRIRGGGRHSSDGASAATSLSDQTRPRSSRQAVRAAQRTFWRGSLPTGSRKPGVSRLWSSIGPAPPAASPHKPPPRRPPMGTRSTSGTRRSSWSCPKRSKSRRSTSSEISSRLASWASSLSSLP